MSLLMAMSTARSSKRVELEGLTVVRRGQEARDARDLAGVARLGQLQQPRKGLGADLGRLERQRIAGGDLGVDDVLNHVRLLGCMRDSQSDGRAGCRHGRR
jgi:hypothetical protein